MSTRMEPANEPQAQDDVEVESPLSISDRNPFDLSLFSPFLPSPEIPDDDSSPMKGMDMTKAAKEVRALGRRFLSIGCAACGRQIDVNADIIGQFKYQFKTSTKSATAVSRKQLDTYVAAVRRVTKNLKRSHTRAGVAPGASQQKDDVPAGLMLNCGRCPSITCPGCGKDSPDSPSEASGSGLRFVWHCDQERLAHIWFLLCAYDHQTRDSKPQSSIVRLRVETAADSEGSVGKHAEKGKKTGEDASKNNPRDAKSNPSQEDQPTGLDGNDIDDITAKTMEALTLLLPSRKRDEATDFDYDPPSAVASLLSRSSIVDRAAELLRNGTLDDLQRRGGLYESLLSFVTLLSRYPATRALLQEPRLASQAGHDLLRLSLGRPTRLQGERVEGEMSVAACMAFLAGPAAILVRDWDYERVHSEGDLQAVGLCGRVGEVAGLLKARPLKRG
ncbi:hypothetical protein B0A50_06299 [Salinomyces thailandicus]|uniref:Uncharacterized protein n=1 Tax=Salinomyces thailandicus TaxID=706561 RepID=A0A4U0TU07_9PEZI|nr:hypothetical protein B0A50_06299 [Salinomyces thailandica]